MVYCEVTYIQNYRNDLFMLLLKDNILNNVVLNNDNDFSYSLLNPYNGQIYLNKFILNRNIVKHIYFHFPNEEAKFWRPKVVFSKSPNK